MKKVTNVTIFFCKDLRCALNRRPNKVLMPMTKTKRHKEFESHF